MEINVTVRHFTINNEIKQHATDAMEAAFSEFRLRISSVNMVLDMQRNLITASINVGIKENPVMATSAAYDNAYKAIDEAIEKAAVQARKFLDKKQDHNKGAGLKDA